MTSYLVDTNVFISLVRDEEIANNFNAKYYSPTNRLITSVVVQGELESLALQRNWGKNKLWRMEKVLERFIILPIKARSIIEAYARIDAYSQGKLADRPMPAGMTSRNMGKNDLWIAATAHGANAALVTTDNDFDHLDGVFMKLDWIDIGEFL